MTKNKPAISTHTGYRIDFAEITDGERWESFAQAFFDTLGLVIEIPPGRGPDGGRDLLVSEQISGTIASQKFTWLVSCKNFAKRGGSVGTEDETNITDRLKQHRADGFLGFYSTVASAALVERLQKIRSSGDIAAFEIYDGSRIELSFHDTGLSSLLQQFFPKSHTALRPIHPLLNKYVELPCEICGRDLLKRSVKEKYSGNILFAQSRDNHEVTVSVHVCCKGQCDNQLEARLAMNDLVALWDDIADYCNPLIFIRRATGFMAQMRKAPASYSQEAYDKYTELFLVFSQRTLRQTTKEDRDHYFDAVEAEQFAI